MITDAEFAELKLKAARAGEDANRKDDWEAYRAWKLTLPQFMTPEQYDALVSIYVEEAEL
jgi:hypothetical protein